MTDGTETTQDQGASAGVAAEQPDEQLGEGGKKALVAEREARKAAETAQRDLQAKLDALSAEGLSDLERAQKVAEDAQEVAAKATREALRFRFAAKHGISDKDAELFLTGETEDQVAAQAQRFAEHSAASPVGAPKPDLTQGGAGQLAPTSPGEQFAQFIESKLT